MPYNPDEFAKSLPPMRLLERAGEGGNSLLDFLQRLQGRPGNLRRPPTDDLQRQRGQMSDLEYRKYLADQLRQGQEAQQSLPVPPSK
jgi:hypothetical protein